MDSIQISNVIKAIEAVVLRGPLFKHEVMAAVKKLTGYQELDQETLDICLKGLEEKYSTNFYGFTFHVSSFYILFRPNYIPD